jgi:hypothetical protein
MGDKVVTRRMCANPACCRTEVSYSMVVATFIPEQTCEEARSPYGLCAPEGHLYEPARVGKPGDRPPMYGSSETLPWELRLMNGLVKFIVIVFWVALLGALGLAIVGMFE